MSLQKQLKALVGSFAWAITKYEEWCLSRVTNRFYYWMGINWSKKIDVSMILPVHALVFPRHFMEKCTPNH